MDALGVVDVEVLKLVYLLAKKKREKKKKEKKRLRTMLTMFPSGLFDCGCFLWLRFTEGNLIGSQTKKTGC